MVGGAVVSIGTFDGVHTGHAAILDEVRRQSALHDGPTIAYTFEHPPRWAQRGHGERYLLLPVAIKKALLRHSVDRVVPASFDDVQGMTPDLFIRSVLKETLRARVVVEGESFRFGRHRAGDMSTLRSIGRRLGLDIVSVPPILVDREPVSSTRIRDALERGDLSTARACLGRHPLLVGTVVHGDGVGTSLGFPTANLSLDPHVLLPPDGIYVVHAFGDGIQAQGLLYLGRRPTLEDATHRCELFLLDTTDRDLYGQAIEVHLLEKARDDRAFASLRALRSQIEKDVRSARIVLAGYPMGERITS